MNTIEVHQGTVFITYEGEVTQLNATDFSIMYVRHDLVTKLYEIFGEHADRMSFNDMLSLILEANTPNHHPPRTTQQGDD